MDQVTEAIDIFNKPFLYEYSIPYGNSEIRVAYYKHEGLKLEIYNIYDTNNVQYRVIFQYSDDNKTLCHLYKDFVFKGSTTIKLKSGEVYDKNVAQKYAVKKLCKGNLLLENYEKNLLCTLFNNYIESNYIQFTLNKLKASDSIFYLDDILNYDKFMCYGFKESYLIDNVLSTDKFYFIEIKDENFHNVLLQINLDLINNVINIALHLYKTGDKFIRFNRKLTFEELYKFDFTAFISSAFKVKYKWVINKLK